MLTLPPETNKGNHPAVAHQPILTINAAGLPHVLILSAVQHPWAHESSEQVWAGLTWTIVNATRAKLGDTEAQRQRYWLERNLPRLDRAALRRAIRLRIWRPTLAALAALVVPMAIALVRTDWLHPSQAARGDWVAPAVALVAMLVVLALAGTALWQYYRGRATTYLPADILDGPVHQRPFEGENGERLARDLPYAAGAGQLYHSNEDVHRIAADLAARDHQLVVFVDDLDRCSPRSVAVVFEAINSLLMYSLAAPRFVIGLDTAVVASRLADSYSPNNGAWRSRDWDDPHIGWSLLRKLSQLAVVLPAVRSPHATRLLRRHAQPEPVQSPTHRDPPPEATAQPIRHRGKPPNLVPLDPLLTPRRCPLHGSATPLPPIHDPRNQRQRLRQIRLNTTPA